MHLDNLIKYTKRRGITSDLYELVMSNGGGFHALMEIDRQLEFLLTVMPERDLKRHLNKLANNEEEIEKFSPSLALAYFSAGFVTATILLLFIGVYLKLPK
jgi:hypothetical protein